jgi:hypothetical protein
MPLRGMLSYQYEQPASSVPADDGEDRMDAYVEDASEMVELALSEEATAELVGAEDAYSEG